MRSATELLFYARTHTHTHTKLTVLYVVTSINFLSKNGFVQNWVFFYICMFCVCVRFIIIIIFFSSFLVNKIWSTRKQKEFSLQMFEMNLIKLFACLLSPSLNLTHSFLPLKLKRNTFIFILILTCAGMCL